MSKIIIDNWCLSSCVFKMRGGSSDSNYYLYDKGKPPKVDEINLCWQNFLTSLVVWDTVFVNLNDDSFSSSTYDAQGINILLGYVGDKNIFETININDEDIFNKSMLSSLECEWYRKSRADTIRESNLLFRAYVYAMKANALQCSYLPHPLRAQELSKTDLYKTPIDANIFLRTLDSQVQRFIEALHKELGKELSNITFPLLYHYIHENSSSAKEELKLALELRKYDSVKKFRKSVAQVEESFEKGNILDVKSAIIQVNQICAEIENQICKKPKGFKVTLGVTPGIKPKFSLSLGRETTTTIEELKTKKKIHTTFLYDLATFAYTGKDNFRKNFWDF